MQTFDSINDALFIHDAQTFRVVDVNRRMLEMYGYDTRAEAVEAFNRMSGGEPPFSMDDAVRWMTKARDEGPQVFEWRSIHRDGHPFWVEIAIRRVRFQTADRLLVVARDVSDRKKTEADRRDCNRWAIGQQNAMGDATVFHRATLACMEGKGYTVR